MTDKQLIEKIKEKLKLIEDEKIINNIKNYLINDLKIPKENLLYQLLYNMRSLKEEIDIPLLDIDEMKKNKNLILLGENESGFVIYNIDTDEVFQYDMDYENYEEYYLETLRPEYSEENGYFKSLKDYLLYKFEV